MSTGTAHERRGSVALFLPTFTPGGIERSLLNLAEGFVDRGVDVDVLVADRRGSFESRVPAAATVVDLEAGRIRNSVVPLVGYLRRESPDVLFSGHTHANLVAVWSGTLARTGAEVVIGVHNTLSESEDAESGLEPTLIRRLIPVTYRRADRVVAVSEGVAEDVAAVAGLRRDEISVIHNPVIGSEFFASVDEPVSHRWLTDGSNRVVLGAGRLTPQKDFGTLVRAFDSVRETTPNARLLVVGSGEKREELERLVDRFDLRPSVEFVGYVENLYAVMNAADVFVLSSRWEGFGIVLVEAMAAGTPVVATDCPHGPSEILDRGRFGRLVGVGDVTEMARAIEETLRAESDPGPLRARAMDFTVEAVVDRYLRLLEIPAE